MISYSIENTMNLTKITIKDMNLILIIYKHKLCVVVDWNFVPCKLVNFSSLNKSKNNINEYMFTSSVNYNISGILIPDVSIKKDLGTSNFISFKFSSKFSFFYF